MRRCSPSIDGEPDPALKARKIQLANFLSASFAPDPADRDRRDRQPCRSDTSIEARAVLNQILRHRRRGNSRRSPKGNVARDPDRRATA